MKRVYMLDCTLRDGGYINNWNFGKDNIEYITKKLDESNVDFVEIGYLNNKSNYNSHFTIFNSIIDNNINNNKVCMINYGECNLSDIPDFDSKNSKVCGIRVAFHKKDMKEALLFSKALKEKKYLVFIQPMVTSSYSIAELDYLLDEVNKFDPYAVYIVDSFGSMDEVNVNNLVNIYKRKLNSSIKIGFHAHNNLQLAYSNAIAFMNSCSDRDIIIDSSVYGVGRGAGNLATELITNYLNKLLNNYQYRIECYLEIVDNYLKELKLNKSWGYCLEYYLSGIYDCHPNYAKCLSELHTITISDMQNVLKRISDDKKYKFDKEYILNLYSSYMNNEINDENSYKILNSILNDKKIILLGNGSSLNRYKDKILSEIDNNTVVISLNSINNFIKCDYSFFSNKRRYISENIENKENIILTSNISVDRKNVLIFDYFSNLATQYELCDNVLLIFLNILIKTEIKEIYLAGFDGFSNIEEENYYDKNLVYFINKDRVYEINKLISKYISLYKNQIKINWLTDSNYIRSDNT